MSERIITEICDAFKHTALVRQGYGALPARYRQEIQRLSALGSMQTFHFNRTVYGALLDEFTVDDAVINLPPSVLQLYDAQLQRLQSNRQDRDDPYFDATNDAFIKDLAILTHRLIPCGAEFVYPFGGIPRSLILRGGARGAIRFAVTLLQTGGLKPFLELHMHPKVLERFNPEGWLLTYEILADLLESNREFRGVQSFSWFLDPALEKVSPHLAYLRQIPEQAGASIFFVATDEPTTSGALKKSAKRRELAEAGQYQPKVYARIWPRSQLLKRTWRSVRR